MVLVDKTIDEMLEEIEFTHLTYYENMPCHYWAKAYDGICFDPKEHVMEPSGLTFPGGMSMELESCKGYVMENLWVHGNDRWKWPEISIKGFAGKNGVVIRIRDNGVGFDHREVHRKYLAKEPYCSNCGFGFRFFDKTPLEISFEDSGTTANIMYKQRMR